MEHITKSYQETLCLAQRFGKTLCGGQVIAFLGGLGAGKTAFCTGIAQGLGCSGNVSSPTFAIVNVYEGRLTFAHFDAYRIKNHEDIEMAGFYDYCDMGAVVAVEWSELVEEYLPNDAITIEMLPLGQNERKIIINGAKGF